MTLPTAPSDDANLDAYYGFVYDKHDGIATVRINRPEVGNALSREMRQAVLRIWADVRADPDVRVIVITGTGERHFCTGADVAQVAATGSVPSRDVATHADTDGVVWTPIQNDIWKPVVVAVNGLVAGGGLHFVADADIVVAADHAAFMDTHVNVGMVGAVENIGLAHRMPLGAVLRMTLQGRDYRLPARRAHELGLVDEVVALEDLAATAETIARSIAANSPRALELSKRAIWGSIGVPRDEALADAWRIVKSHWAHPDFVEGPRAFAEKRRPVWTREGVLT